MVPIRALCQTTENVIFRLDFFATNLTFPIKKYLPFNFFFRQRWFVGERLKEKEEKIRHAKERNALYSFIFALYSIEHLEGVFWIGLVGGGDMRASRWYEWSSYFIWEMEVGVSSCVVRGVPRDFGANPRGDFPKHLPLKIALSSSLGMGNMMLSSFFRFEI